MSSLVPELAGRSIAIVIILAALLAIVVGTSAMMRGPWWPSVIFQTGQRPKIYWRWLVGTFAVTAFVGFVSLGAPGMAITTLLWLLMAPRIIGPRATAAAWREDSPEQREGARAVRNRIRRANEQAEIAEGVQWPEYVLDRARAEMQARYRPPGS